MPGLRARNAVVAAAIQSVQGVAEALVPANDHVHVENPRLSPNLQTVQTNFSQASIDASEPIPVGMPIQLSCDIPLYGDLNAGDVPNWDVLIRICGRTRVDQAAIAAEALAAGGTTTKGVLGVSASSTPGAHEGAPILFTGTVNGTSFISDYQTPKEAILTDLMSAALDATTNYSIPACVIYAPASTSLPFGTLAVWMDGRKFILRDAAGTVNVTATVAGFARASFTITGVLDSDSDEAVPSIPARPVGVPKFVSGAGLINRQKAIFNALTLNGGETVAQDPDPEAPDGLGLSEVTERSMTGTIDPNAELKATRDTINVLRAGTPQIIHARFGTAAGNRIGLTVPEGLLTGLNPGDRNAKVTDELSFFCQGADRGHYITVW